MVAVPELNSLNFLTMIRTRAITDKLSYDDLVKQGIVPDLVAVVNQSPTTVAVKRYPPFVYAAKNFPFFGMLLDYIVRAGLRIHLQQPIELGVDPTAEIIPTLPETEMIERIAALETYGTSRNLNAIATAALTLTSTLYGNPAYTSEQIQTYVPTLVNMLKEVVAKWTVYGAYLNGTVKFNTEFSHGSFAGHPDVVTDQCVLDIKTTGSFGKMAKESCLQVLAYYALMKQKHPALQYVGFILPMQREVVLYNVSNWDPTGYLQLLSDQAAKLAQAPTVLNIGKQELTAIADQFITMNLDGVSPDDKEAIVELLMNAFNEQLGAVSPLSRFHIGSHYAKGKDVAATLRKFATSYPGLPCQMFLGNPRTGKRDAKTAGQLQGAAAVIRETGLQYYTHAAYVINLCANASDERGYWQQRYLNEDLDFTAAIGGRGVVVHTGARKHLTEEEGLQIMEYMVRTALPHATEQCPLLLETPCGEGTEVCTTIQDLGNFFYRFSEDERKRLGLCLDTCHCYSAGYDPLTYMQHWEKYCPVPIKLVHFNDSKRECGSRVDRHAPPGQGHIGMEKLVAVAEWCHERNIPMVHE